MPADVSRVTAELFSIPVGDAYLVYAPIRQAAFLANAAVVNLLADLQQGAADPSASEVAEWIELLRQLEIVDGGEEVPPVTAFRGDPKPTAVTLFLTTACNLRCTYCYASAGDTPTRVMPLEVAQRGIDFILANAVELGKSEIEVAYHGGGEPSVNWKTLTGSWEYARQKATEAGIQVCGGMASNGVMPDEKIDWIIANLDGVSLSFDGLPEVHDTHRLTVLGQGSSSAVIHTIRRFDDAGFPYGLRLTVTREHLDKIEASVRFICENFRPQRIQVEPAYALGRWRDAPSAETAEFISGYRAASAVARHHGHELEFSGARVGTLGNHFCGVTQDSFCLTADGSVSGCYEVFLEQNNWSDYFMYGRYNEAKSTYDFNLPVLNNLRHQTVDQHAFCQGCFAKWTCGGDCHHKALDINGPGEFAGTDRCHIIRELTKDQLLQKIADSGGLFWHQAPQEMIAAAFSS